MGKKNSKIKNIIKSCVPLTYIIPLILFFVLFKIQSHPVWFAIISLIPGVYALLFAIFYGEMESAGRGSGTYRGYQAVIISFQHFWFFMLFGLWVPLMYLGYVPNIKNWWSIIGMIGVYLVPSLIIYFVEKKDKKPISKINYWIQTPDLNVKDGEALTLKETQNFIINYNWKK